MEAFTVRELMNVVFDVLMPILFGVIGYLLVDLRTSVREQLRTHDTRIKETADQLASLQADLPVQYVRRDEFIRQVTQIDRKLDAIMTRLDALPCKRLRRGGDRECDAV